MDDKPARVFYMRDKPMENISETEVFHDCDSVEENNLQNVTNNLCNPEEFHETLKEMVHTAQQLLNEVDSTLKPRTKRNQRTANSSESQCQVRPTNSINLEIHLQIPQHGLRNMTYQVTGGNDVPIMGGVLGQIEYNRNLNRTEENSSTGVEPRRCPGFCGMQPAGEKCILSYSSTTQNDLQKLCSKSTPQTSQHYNDSQKHITDNSLPLRKSLSQNIFSTCPNTQSTNLSTQYQSHTTSARAGSTTVPTLSENILMQLKRWLITLSSYMGGFADLELYEIESKSRDWNVNRKPQHESQSILREKSSIIVVIPHSIESQPPPYAAIGETENTFNGQKPNPRPQSGSRDSGEHLHCRKKDGFLPSENVPCNCGGKIDFDEIQKCICNANGALDEDCKLPNCIEEAGFCTCDCTDTNKNLMHCCNLAIDSNCICMNYYKPKAYKLALPQHRDLKVCIGCRFEPSPLINEKGEVFCPGNCGCCLCPWQRRQSLSNQKLQLHDKLKVCKCRERGTIFGITAKESKCSNVMTFDLCPCREVAEAKFLELYDREMYSLNEEELDVLRGEPVFLKDVVELRPPFKHRPKSSRKTRISYSTYN